MPSINQNILSNDSDLKQVMRKLAYFKPSAQDEYGHQVIDYLVLDALSGYNVISVTAPEICQYIKNSFKLDFDEAEINSSARRLSSKRLVELSEEKKFEHPKIKILPKTAEDINTNLKKIIQLEEQVFEEWENGLCEKYKALPIIQDNIDQINYNLQLFTSQMLMKHGVECVALMYPEEPKAKKLLEEASNNIFNDLPQIDPISDDVCKIEIPLFFKTHSSDRKAYISSLFNSSFFWHLIQVDESCSQLLKEITRGQRLYLDNNIIFSIVGLHGEAVLRSIHTMLRMADSLGYELWVTTKTIDEFHHSMNIQMEELKSRPSLPQDLARIAVDHLGKDSFVTIYWSEFVENGTSIEEFIAEKSLIDDVLEGLNIQKTNKFRKDIENSEELLDAESILTQACGDYFHPAIVEHDAFHQIFINKIRKEPKKSFSDATAWFLTHDTKLPVFDRVARKGQSYLPFCIMTDQWVQLNRPLLSRTQSQEEYEESFHQLVTQPFLRTMFSTIAMEKSFSEVLGRMARYENMIPEFALTIVTDTHFMQGIQNDTEQEIDKKVDNKLVDIAKQLEEQNRDLKVEVDTKTKQVEVLKQKTATLESSIQESSRRQDAQVESIKALDEKIKLEQAKNVETSKELEQAEKRARDSEQSLSDEKERRNVLVNRVILWGIFTLLVGSCSFLLWDPFSWISWGSWAKHPKLLYLKIGVQVMLPFIFLNIPLREHWVKWIGFIVTIIACLLAIAAR